LGVAEAVRCHQDKLELDDETTEKDIASGRTNPKYQAVRHWHDNWRMDNLGPRTGVGIIEVVNMERVLFSRQILTAYKQNFVDA